MVMHPSTPSPPNNHSTLVDNSFFIQASLSKAYRSCHFIDSVGHPGGSPAALFSGLVGMHHAASQARSIFCPTVEVAMMYNR